MAKQQRPATYKTKGGEVLTLRPVKPVVIRRFTIEYRKKHSEPTPPLIKVVIQGGDNWFQNYEDETYKKRHKDWSDGMDDAYIDFMLQYGVASEPPSDWQPLDLFENAVTKKKVLWLEEILETEEYELLVAAITEQTVPTEASIEEAEKNSG